MKRFVVTLILKAVIASNLLEECAEAIKDIKYA